MAIYYNSDTNTRYGLKGLAKAGLSTNYSNIHVLNSIAPLYDSFTQQISDSGNVEEVDGSYFVVWTIEDRDLGEAKKDMKLALAKIRYTKEVNGTETSDGTKVLTDRESQATTNAIYSALVNNLISSTQWKSPEDWTSVTSAELLPIVTALNVHVSKAFSAEQTVSAAIDASTTSNELRAINLNADFETAYLA